MPDSFNLDKVGNGDMSLNLIKRSSNTIPDLQCILMVQVRYDKKQLKL